MTHNGQMARNAHPAFMLWIRAVQGQWSIVLDAPLDVNSYIAAYMLQECPTFDTRLAQQQIQAIMSKP